MDVTTANFGEVREIIEKRILPNTKYIGFDLEFSGLRYDKFERDYINYLPFEKYKKMKYVAETYQIMQLGLSFVAYDEKESKMKVYPFNFYLFPRNPATFDKNLTMQLGCVKFNAEHGMDWNKWIREGINYVKLSQIQAIEEYQKNRTYKDLILSLSEDLEPLARDFVRNLRKMQNVQLNTRLAFKLPSTHSVQKILTNIFYKFVEEHRLCLSLLEKEEELIIEKIPQSQRNKIIQKRQQETFGFALLFQHIWRQKIPFIGHNCNLDLMYVFHHLVAPLPESYFEYKQILRFSGNSFYDTKYIAGKFVEVADNGSRLEDLLRMFKSSGRKLMNLTVQNEFSRYSLDKQALHEAGYDSYLTVWVFCQLIKQYQGADDVCKDKINLVNSFFYIDLSKDQDEVNSYYAENILRVNISMDEKDDVRTRRMEEVKIIKHGLDSFRDAFVIHEGYREIFIEIKKDRKLVIKRIFEMVERKMIKEINTFPSYLAWQKERVSRELKRSEEYRRNHNRGFEKKARMEDESSSESGTNPKRVRKVQKR